MSEYIKYLIKIPVSITINRNIEVVKELICDVSRWEQLSSNFENSEFLIKTSDQMLTSIKSRHNAMSFLRYTYRKISEKEMFFKHLNTTYPINIHYGSWHFEALNEDITNVKLEHKIKIAYGMIGFMIGKIIIAPVFFEKPCLRMLKQLKNSIENMNI
jgi:ribosome-associated toxin RatA of RatAB toxin-antitoxin module